MKLGLKKALTIVVAFASSIPAIAADCVRDSETRVRFCEGDDVIHRLGIVTNGPVMKIVGLSAVIFVTDTCSLVVGNRISRIDMSRPRYDLPARYAVTVGNTDNFRTSSSASSGPMTWSHVTSGCGGFSSETRTWLGNDLPVEAIARCGRASRSGSETTRRPTFE